jgi:hypothetical protein
LLVETPQGASHGQTAVRYRLLTAGCGLEETDFFVATPELSPPEAFQHPRLRWDGATDGGFSVSEGNGAPVVRAEPEADGCGWRLTVPEASAP